jgi:Fe-S-cluster-containing dehydrogenase component/DMSO reductase anchor subunit
MAKLTGFIFDYSKCVGCGACVVACYNENGTKPPLAWRKVSSYNPQKIPLLGFVHLSLACNHCSEAPCMKACPSLAYSFHGTTGAVIHNPNACLGCKYCTWACPFGAPQYSKEEGIIEKCHFCYHRLEKGQKPSCATNCPTGALGFGEIEEKPQPEAFGLSQKAIYPRISILNDELINHSPDYDPNASGFERSLTSKVVLQNTSQHNGVKEEWPLAIFTFLATILTGYIFSLPFENIIELPIFVFAAIAFIALTFSTIHLGKPFRAYLSIRNLKTSWLSREVLLFGVFCIVSFISLIVKTEWLFYLSSVISILLLFSIEMVYSVTKRKYITPVHSANTVLIALTFAALFAGFWNVLVALLAVKSIIFIINNGIQQVKPSGLKVMGVLIRISFGFVIPFGMINYSQDFSLLPLFASVLLAEMIDRLLYYNDFEAERPFN